eukprot:17803-Heterococcus_DN1.PRE.3
MLIAVQRERTPAPSHSSTSQRTPELFIIAVESFNLHTQPTTVHSETCHTMCISCRSATPRAAVS